MIDRTDLEITPEERFRELYVRNRAKIVAYALRRSASPDTAADIVAETFTIAWRRLDEIPTDERSVLWLYVTARQVLANAGRREWRDAALRGRLATDIRRVPIRAESLEGGGLEASVVLAELAEDDREVLMLAAWEGLSGRDLADAIGCSPAAARVRLHRARARLDDALRELDPGGSSRHFSDATSLTPSTPIQEVSDR